MKKKLFILSLSLSILSCSSDSGCENKVYSVYQIPDSQGIFINYISYGRNIELALQHEVNQSTYNYYQNLHPENENPVCWEGPK